MAALALSKSNLNIPGGFNNYLSQVLKDCYIFTLKSLRVVIFLLLKIPVLQRVFWWFFFSCWSFFHKPFCKLVVAMQGSLLSPRELYIDPSFF